MRNDVISSLDDEFFFSSIDASLTDFVAITSYTNKEKIDHHINTIHIGNHLSY